MKYSIYIVLLLFISCNNNPLSSDADDLKRGCTLEDACNYDADAVIYDGNCFFEEDLEDYGYCDCDDLTLELDECGECGGNGYDFCDDDNDGILNLVDGCPLDPDNDADSDGICGDVDNCPNVANDQSDEDNDDIGDVCDPCLDDALNECFPEEGFIYIWTYDWSCDNYNVGQTTMTFFSDGTWLQANGFTGTWGQNLGTILLPDGNCPATYIDADLWLTFDNYNTYYYWDLEGNMGSDSIEGYHDDVNYSYGESVDGISTITLYNAILHGDINKIHQTSNSNPAFIKNIDQEK